MFVKNSKVRINAMARRTKEEAQATRTALLDAAERLFQQHGVAGTTLNDIAQEAALTRGAVYWHFTDKADLFNAMLERVALPKEELAPPATACTAPVLPKLRQRMSELMVRIEADAQLQRVMEIMLLKSEYVDAMAAIRERRLQMRTDFREGLEAFLRAAQKHGEVRRDVPVAVQAIGLHALLDGLLQDWLLERRHDLRSRGMKLVDVYLDGLASP